MAEKNRQDGKDKGGATPLAEWLVAALGLLLVLGALAFLGFRALRSGDAPPDVSVHPQDISKVQAGYRVQFRARNQGDTTAEGVVVEGTLSEGDKVIERSEATVHFVPVRSEREGGLFFKKDPRAFRLELRALGYVKP